jgi:hypothetical protein
LKSSIAEPGGFATKWYLVNHYIAGNVIGYKTITKIDPSKTFQVYSGNTLVSNSSYTVDYNTYFSSLLKESDPKKLYINTESYPSDKEICEYFNDDLSSRI